MKIIASIYDKDTRGYMHYPIEYFISQMSNTTSKITMYDTIHTGTPGLPSQAYASSAHILSI